MNLEQLERKIQQLEGRIVGFDVLMNVVLREWGNPPEKVMAYLQQTQHRMIATSLPHPCCSDAHMEGLEHQLNEAIAALRGRIDYPEE
ncbi:hypothetical protein [Stenotrophomonas sp. 278]|uniref:hypothetical protein n=1 Tax=Stenotrophomonas sp. 278 TaxID=2479851 RepID=UPI000F689EDA|nr:hypothetical protein [Stenotrophomonas sp. 278]RRU17846.1 hypothetical protein EGJ34_06840 [Stenotrophomonas sp. 278]